MIKALALGAKAVLLGRPYCYGLAVGGEEGVRNVLENLIADGKYGEWLMISPPLIVTAAQIEEIVALIGQTLEAYEGELRAAKII